MNVKDLKPEEKKELLKQLQAEEAAEKVKIKEDRKAMKEMASETVIGAFGTLMEVSNLLSCCKRETFDNFDDLIKLKNQLYEVKDEQQSHTFSSLDGNKRITLGYRILDRYDESADAGIAKVREYVDSLAKDAASAKLVNMVNGLLRRDAKGNLKANRVLELLKMANDSDSELFKDGVQIIADAHRPEKSRYFVEAEYKNDEGKWCGVGLSISSVDFPEKQA